MAVAITALMGGLVIAPVTQQSAEAQVYGGLKTLNSNGGTPTSGTTNDRGDLILVGRGGGRGGGHGGRSRRAAMVVVTAAATGVAAMAAVILPMAVDEATGPRATRMPGIGTTAVADTTPAKGTGTIGRITTTMAVTTGTVATTGIIGTEVSTPMAMATAIARGSAVRRYLIGGSATTRACTIDAASFGLADSGLI
jgi:hypothetical protein